MSYSEMLRKIENGEITPIQLTSATKFASEASNAINVALNLAVQLEKRDIPAGWKDMTIRSLTNLSQKLFDDNQSVAMARWLLKHAPQDATTLVMHISWNAELSAGIRAGSKKITVSVEDCESFSSMFEMAQQMMEMWSDGHEKISFEIA